MKQTSKDLDSFLSKIKFPLTTAKSCKLFEKNKIVFIVDRNIGKNDIKSGFQQIFQKRVLKVNTLNFFVKKKYNNHYISKKAPFKKAIISFNSIG